MEMDMIMMAMAMVTDMETGYSNGIGYPHDD